MTIQNDLDAIVGRINQIIPDAKVYLFGSYAIGKQRKDSDIDLCVVAPNYDERRMQVLYSIRTAIRGATNLPVDILAFTNEEFESKLSSKSTIQYTIANEGVLLSEQHKAL
ncbi:MAG: nucleotidyltransferase domain-containing protein [Defluviitaleaceae bacterium]|nr:nucleotidyltransferase domain-containing protein [Defluviitaleaceae bacterium]